MKKILVLKHMPSQNPGIFREHATSHNIEFDEIDLHAGDLIPDLNSYDGLWVMGGSMDVWQDDEYPWLIDEKRVIADAVSNRKIPFLGICLGHQLLAEVMGGKVEPAKNNEIGLFEITRTPEGENHPLLNGLPQPSLWVNAHRTEVTRIPPQAVTLAKSKNCEHHILQVTELAYSCQFHPEVCDHTVSGWMEIPGIPEALYEILGSDGLENFHSSIADHLAAHNLAAVRLFSNWINIVYPT